MKAGKKGQQPANNTHRTASRQPLDARTAQTKTLPTAPPAYRPNPVQRVLQSKPGTAAAPKTSVNGQGHGPPQLSQQKTPALAGNGASSKSSTGSVITRQTSKSTVVQAVKFYPNLHPGAVEPVDPSNVFRLNNFANQYRLHKVNSHSVNVPNQQYNFVRTREGEMLLHARYRHPSIAEGRQVLYAGEIFFNNGQLEWWSNGSGHYQPYAEDAVQANLPMDQFYSYQQVIKGEHKRKRS